MNLSTLRGPQGTLSVFRMRRRPSVYIAVLTTGEIAVRRGRRWTKRRVRWAPTFHRTLRRLRRWNTAWEELG